MADITAAMVKELREMTGAGMMDCKKALNETNGNMEEAVDFLRKSGAAKAVKKESRIAAEGICRIADVDNQVAAVVEVNSETDFVAKNEVFQTYVENVAKQVVGSDATTVEELMNEAWIEDSSKTVSEALVEKIAVIGEKLSIRRFAKVKAENGCVVSYVHGGGKIGVIIKAECGVVNDTVKEALTNIAMQTAAMNPEYISRDDISKEEVDKIREITIDSSLNDPASLPKPILSRLLDKAVADGLWSAEDVSKYEENKNDKFLFNKISDAAVAAVAGLAMADKANISADKIFSGMVEGRISKQLKEISLMDQTYVKAEDGKQSVAAYLAQVGKDAGTTITVKQFVRYVTGEGLEKKVDDFAAEVAAQAGL